MIVDDDVLITSTLSILLETMLDAKIITYNNPVEALTNDLLINGHINLVISDFMMPGMSGFEFLKTVNTLDPTCICILLTGYADKENAIKSINQLDLYQYVEKPWDNAEFINIIENGLDKKQLQNELSNKMVELEKSNFEISKMHTLLKKDLAKNADANIQLEQTIIKRNIALRNILDNVGQGFLTIGKDMIIGEEYSTECIDIFKTRISGESFSNLLYADNEEEKHFLDEIIFEILNGSDNVDLYLPLLPEEVMIKNKYITIEYKLINKEELLHLEEPEDRFMIVLTDITAQRLLEAKYEEEKDILKMVVGVVVRYREFIDSIRDYQKFCLLTQNIAITNVEEDITKLYRNIHTYKGTFSQLKLTKTSKRLHNFESKLYNLLKDPNEKDFLLLLNQHDMVKFLDDDMDILIHYLGKDFITQKDLLLVDKIAILYLEEKITELFPNGEAEEIRSELSKLRCKSLSDLIEPYAEYLETLSEKLNKPMNPLIIECSNIMIDTDKFYNFSKSLTHIFRNIMKHGIEDIETRHSLNKPYSGTAKFNAYLEDESIVIHISDDGAGLDVDKLHIKAEALLTPDEIRLQYGRHIQDIIFRDLFTTDEKVTELAGRGIGLSSVKYETELLGGTVQVESIINNGCEFIFNIPLNSDIYKPILTKNLIINSIIKHLIGIVYDYTGLLLTEKEHKNAISVQDTFASSINIFGMIDCTLFLVVDKMLLEKLANEFVFSDIKENEKNGILQAVISEILNTIIGNSLRELIDCDQLIEISTPEKVTISEIKSMWAMQLSSDIGDITLHINTNTIKGDTYG